MDERRLPDFIMVGAMRSGSTSLYRYVGAHPEVFLAPKELQFFTEHYDRGLDWYAAQFTDLGAARLAGEATADYLARESAMTHISQTLPSVRLVASLRHPIDRTYSHFGLLRERGREARSFARAISEELDAVAQHGDGSPGVIYLSHSMYDVHLQRAYTLFARERIFVSIFERMVRNPEPVFAELCRFLGVDDGFVPANLGRRINPYVTFRSLRLRSLSQSLPGPVGRLVARLNTRRDAQPDPPDAETAARLRDFFAPRIAAVEELLGEPLPEWR